MTKPIVDTEWATTLGFNNIVDDQGNTGVALNRTEPSVSYKLSGAPPQTPVIRGYMNYWMYAVHSLLEWEITKEVGQVLHFADSAGMTAAQLEADRGGTWVDHGTDTLAGLTIRVFEKTV